MSADHASSPVLRTDFVDFPTAWAIQNEVGDELLHVPRCSAAGAGSCFLCDCGAVTDEWERRVRAMGVEPGRTYPSWVSTPGGTK